MVDFVKKAGKTITNGVRQAGDRVALETLSSPLAEMFYPVAASLLKHAKEEDKPKLNDNDIKLIRLKVKNSKVWNQQIMGDINAKKVWQKWEEAKQKGVKEGEKFFIQDIVFTKSDNADLYYGIHKAKVYGIKKGDKIMLYIEDNYNFENHPDNWVNQIGYRSQERGWLTKYPISVYIMDIPKP